MGFPHYIKRVIELYQFLKKNWPKSFILTGLIFYASKFNESKKVDFLRQVLLSR